MTTTGTNKSDVVVVGGGVTGLATGALLAKGGKRVTVLEKGNQPGGRAYTREEKGFTLNYGPRAIYRPDTGVFAELFRRLGRPKPTFGYPEAVRSYWADGERWGAVGAKAHQVMTTKLFPLGTRMAFAKTMLALRAEKPERLGDETWGAWVDRHTSDPALRRFLRAFGTVNTYTRPSDTLSARFLVDHIQRNILADNAVGYMEGGWRSMYDAFIDELQRNGGALVTGARVERLEVRDGRAVAAVTHDARYEADAFVCTLPAQDAPSVAEPGSELARELAQWAALEDVRACTVDLGLSRPLRSDDATYVYDVRHDLYYSVHSESAHDLAPAGGWMLHAMAYLSPEEAADDTLAAARKDELVAGLDRWFAGWRDAVVVERTLPNVRVVCARNTPTQYLRNRVPLRSQAAANLYYAGDARDLPGNLTEVCFASALEAADAVTASVRATEPIASASVN